MVAWGETNRNIQIYEKRNKKQIILGKIFLYIRQFGRDLVQSHFSIIARDEKNYAAPHTRNTRKTWIDDPQIDHKIRYQELMKRGRNTWIFRRIMILYNMFSSEHFFGAVTFSGGMGAGAFWYKLRHRFLSYCTLLHIATWTVLRCLGWRYEEDIRLVPVATYMDSKVKGNMWMFSHVWER